MGTVNAVWIYCDGGLAGGNPSYTGGSWAFRVVCHADPTGGYKGGPRDDEADAVLLERSGVLLPADVARAAVTNNNVELLAVCEAALTICAALPNLPAAPERVTFCPDSQYARDTFGNFKKRCGMPPPTALTLRMREARAALVAAGIAPDWELVAGHASPDELTAGYMVKKNGATYRVSRHNDACDKLCTATYAPLIPPSAEEVAERQGDGLFTVGEVARVTVAKPRKRPATSGIPDKCR